MSRTSCPVAVEGWGGAGDACGRARAALESVEHVLEVLRGAFPEEWRSRAADGYIERLEELIGAGRRVRDAVAEVDGLARQLAADVVVAHVEAD